MVALEFDGALYPASAVRRALSDYASIARIVMRKRKKAVSAELKLLSAPIERTALEFANYVLELSCVEDGNHGGD